MYVKYVKLKQRSKLKTQREGRKKTPSDEPTVPSVHSVGALGTLRNDWNSLDTVGWTDGPFPSCVGWIGEEKPRRQQLRMNRRSIGGNRQSIRWSSLNKTETRQDQRNSTRWTDGSAAVYPMVTWKLTVRNWPLGLQHQIIWRTVAA
jgi:hypothetical protein